MLDQPKTPGLDPGLLPAVPRHLGTISFQVLGHALSSDVFHPVCILWEALEAASGSLAVQPLLVAGGGEVSSPGPSFFRVANTEPLSAHLLLRSLVHILRVSVTSDGRECRAAASRFRCLRPVQILRIGVELELGVV